MPKKRFHNGYEDNDYYDRDTRILRPHAQKKFSNEENVDYLDRETRIIRPHAGKRGRLCIARGHSCSAALNLCCGGWECRCNLFGSNCKCERPGLFGMG